MAILGGVGNPVGGSFTGPAEALEIIQNHAYAYSGQHGGSTTPVTHLDFKTGNYLFVGKIWCNGATDITSAANGLNSVFDISLNGIVIAGLKTATAGDVDFGPAENDLIIPPYTEVKVVAVSDTGAATRYTDVIMAGRIYRTRD